MSWTQQNHRPVSLERSKVILSNQNRVDLNKTHLEKTLNMNSNGNSAVTTLSSLNSFSSDAFSSVANLELNLNSIFLDMNDVTSQDNDDDDDDEVTRKQPPSTTSIIETSSASTTTTNQPKCESVYFEMDEFDFSSDEDDSYETESNEYDEENENCDKLNETDSFISNKIFDNNKTKRSEQGQSPAPPKPKRTFEHDAYVHLKEEDKFKTRITSNNHENYIANINSNRTFRNNQTKSMYNEKSIQLNEHIYETLPSVRDLNNQNTTSHAVLNNKQENKFTSNTNIANKSTKNDVIMRKLRLNNLNVKKDMVRIYF
jgi:hypothetical protein